MTFGADAADVFGAPEPVVAQAAPTASPVLAPPAPLAYEPPATLAEALLDAPDTPPADLLAPTVSHDDWPLAGFAPAEPAGVVAEPGALATSWRRHHDDLLPARGRGRR